MSKEKGKHKHAKDDVKNLSTFEAIEYLKERKFNDAEISDILNVDIGTEVY